MLSLALALFLAAQDAPPAAAEPAPAPAPAGETLAAAPEERWPTGAPRDDYQFVGWCYGALRAYLELRDEVMPEVTRIETTFRRPGSKLADDLKVYDDMQKDGRAKLRQFQAAMTAAEKASVRPINIQGAEAVKLGRSVWKSSNEVGKARLAQEWMSWALPAKCESTASALETRSKLAAATLRANEPASVSEGSPPTP